MKRNVFISILMLICTAVYAGNVTYTADDTSIFQNPERGFITMLEKKVSKNSPYCVKGQESTIDSHISNDKISLVLVHYYLDNFKTTATLPNEILNGFDKDMEVLRNKGIKCILRFSYTNSTYEKGNGEESAADASLSIVQSHISQYKSHWQANADVMFVFQAGFVGAWGEWYYSDNFGNQRSTINNDRRALIDTLLASVPKDRCIQIRTPLFKTGYISSTAPLTESEAYKGTAKARLAHHNDAFLENYGDMGTYSDTATQKPYIAQETLYVPIGGESCILDDNVAASNASYAKTTGEMSRLHWTFIQSGYSTVVTNRWRQDGTFDELNRRMGYRYQLVSATLPDNGTAGSQVNISLKIRNAGYAPLYNERHVYLVMKNSSKTYSVRLNADPRRWLPNNKVSTVSESVTLPSNMEAGTYQMYLHMPDAYASLASDPRYSVRFANSSVWESATGMNKLNASISVSGGNPGPTPQPGNAVSLPATLNKANVDSYSEDMTWYNNDYFDFGPEDATNTSRWAKWNVMLQYPGEYYVSEVLACSNGHAWTLELLDASDNVASTYVTENKWAEGSISYENKWNLSALPAGNYKLRIHNSMEWGKPKLLSITLTYDGELPNAIHDTTSSTDDGILYDLLGRKVDASYKGIVVTSGERKYILR